VNLKTIADYLTTQLTGDLQYVVTDDVQFYTNEMKLGGSEYVPSLLKLITPFVNENKFIETYVCELEFLVRREDRDKFQDDVSSFISNESDGIDGSHYVTKTYQRLIFKDDETINGVDYMRYTLEFTYVYALSIVGSQSVLKLDNEVIPFVSCQVDHSVSYVSNKANGNNYRMTNDLITLVVPLILGNSKIVELYGIHNSDEYNVTFALDINGLVKNVALKKTALVLNQSSQITGLTLILETAYPRVSITLDAHDIPLSAYKYDGKKTVEDGAKNGTNLLKGYGTEKVRTWSMSFVKDDSTLWDKLVADAYGMTLNETYELNRDGLVFNVIMSQVSEGFTETGDMSLDCSFIEYE